MRSNLFLLKPETKSLMTSFRVDFGSEISVCTNINISIRMLSGHFTLFG